ncbi:ATP-binding protein [Roseisolibacter sp. H3M3-2]|uniref:PAS domain-containing sensor histidine kinase n=1 Tax=Roseisolibacter sp. H3M3-2 TaxID=3031323 RepID=UPI0023DA663D|nr:ATP-binding protein [Roseisolibacter sp. H3M3-2]MDF1504416.1 PAS domain-containing protein [Roseisolibacter sp. H3M3-2]
MDSARALDARRGFLLALADALRPLADPVAIQREVCRRLGEHLAAEHTYYVECATADDRAVVAYDHARGGGASLAGEYRLSACGDLASLHGRGEPVVVDDAQRSALVSGAGRAASAAARVALVAFPLVKSGELVAALCVATPAPRGWTAEEVALVADAAERAWAAVERARAEAALRESEARFRTVAELVPDLLWESDPDGATRWFNARWTEYTGQPPDAARGWGWVDALHPDDRARAGDDYRRAVARGEPLVHEHRIRGRDGRHRWFQVRAEPLRDADGRIVRWFGAASDVHARRLALEEVERRVVARTGERDALRRRLFDAEEAERRRIAGELHDQLGQELTAFRLGLDDALRLAARRQADAAAAALGARLTQLQALAGRMTAGVRAIALELRPPELDDVGLASALESYAREWSARYGVGAEVAVTGLAASPPVAPEVASALYRVAQEALTNVAKHARASQASVVVDRTDGQVRLVIEDDGCGFDPAATAARVRRERRFGLAGMRERAALLGGELTLESAPGRGTAVHVRLPAAVPPAAP